VVTVLVLCVQNAGRSQMAAGFLRQVAGLRVLSGGSAPGEQVNERAVVAMAELGIDIADQRPTGFTTEMVASADFIVTMGCGDTCPVFPGKTYLDWDIEDPAELDLEGVRRVRDAIALRVDEFVRTMGGDGWL
jgi:arsenate reductase (thioredoxin)